MQWNSTAPTSSNVNFTVVAERKPDYFDSIAKIKMQWHLKIWNYPWKMISVIMNQNWIFLVKVNVIWEKLHFKIKSKNYLFSNILYFLKLDLNIICLIFWQFQGFASVNNSLDNFSSLAYGETIVSGGAWSSAVKVIYINQLQVFIAC